MTVVKITRNIEFSEYIVEVSGHAGYAEQGKDIVCASIATLCNLFIAYFGKDAVIETGEGRFFAAFQPTEERIKILDAVVACFEELVRQFPENVRVENFYSSGEQ